MLLPGPGTQPYLTVTWELQPVSARYPRCKEAVTARDKCLEDLTKARREHQDRTQQLWATRRHMSEVKVNSVEELTAEVRGSERAWRLATERLTP